MIRPRILIVEDEGVVALDLQEQLTHLGYEVVGYVGLGEEAIRKATETMPDIVLMDVILEGEMDGIEAAAQIRAQTGLPVVYLTALANDSVIQRAKVTEPFGYILKPFTERDLKAGIEMALYKHKLERERENLIQKLQDALARVKMLSGLLPICCSCKKIRDDQGYWHQVEAYLRDHSEAEFTHGLCPRCKDEAMERFHLKHA